MRTIRRPPGTQAIKDAAQMCSAIWINKVFLEHGAVGAAAMAEGMLAAVRESITQIVDERAAFNMLARACDQAEGLGGL